MDGLGALITEMSLDDDPATYPVAAIENILPVASYSWLDKPGATIKVPCEF